MTELTAAPITEPAMPIFEASATLVAAAAAPAMIWGMETVIEQALFRASMAMVCPMEWFSCTPLLSAAGVMTRVRGASVYLVVIRGPPGVNLLRFM